MTSFTIFTTQYWGHQRTHNSFAIVGVLVNILKHPDLLLIIHKTHPACFHHLQGMVTVEVNYSRLSLFHAPNPLSYPSRNYIIWKENSAVHRCYYFIIIWATVVNLGSLHLCMTWQWWQMKFATVNTVSILRCSIMELVIAVLQCNIRNSLHDKSH